MTSAPQAKTFTQLQDMRKTVTVLHIDVRSPSEVCDDGYMPGTNEFIPFTQLSSTFHSFLSDDKSTHLAFSCQSGGRSMKACQLACEIGFSNVYNIEGGFKAFQASGEAVRMDGTPPVVKCFYDKATGTCQYLVLCCDSKQAVVIDPVLDYDNVSSRVSHSNAELICKFAKDLELDLVYVLETHAHADHLSSSQIFKRTFPNVKVCIGSGISAVQTTFAGIFGADISCDGSQFDKLFQPNEEFVLGKLRCRALHVPGHTPDHMCYMIGDALFSGDTLFMPDSGTARCDFPAGSAKQLYQSIKNVLYELPSHSRVFVGHDYMPNGRALKYQSTIEEQKLSNIHLKSVSSESEFVNLRQGRDGTLNNPKLLFQSLNVNIRAGHFPETTGSLGPVMAIPIVVPQELFNGVLK